ncbi:MAG: hypothetical protein ACPG31_09830 [Planctomycetota bacterium]
MTRASLPGPLRQLLQQLERRLFTVLFVFGVGRLLLHLCALLFGLYLLDRLLDPPVVVRLVLGATAIGILLWQSMRDLIKPLAQRPVPRDLAAIWERKAPQFHDRLATAIELSEDPGFASREMLAEVTEEAVQLADGLDARTVVPTGRARRSMFGGSAATAVLLFGVWGFPDEAVIFFDRLLGGSTPWPSDTTLVLMPAYMEGLAEPVAFDQEGNESYSLAVARGSVLSLRVRAEGEIPDRLLAISGDTSRPMHDLGGGNFVLRLPPLREDQEFHFKGGDDTDGRPNLRLRAGDAPGVGSWLVRTQPPAYTELPAEEGAFHEVRLLRGSTIDISLQADRRTVKAEATRLDGSSMELEADAEGKYHYSIAVEGSGEVSIALTGGDGFRKERAGVLKWTATPDRRPEPRILFPSERWLTVPGGRIPVALSIEDDFGIQEAQLFGQKEMPLPLQAPNGRRLLEQVMRLDAPEDFSAESFDDNRFRLRLAASDAAEPEAHLGQTYSPWIEVVPASVEEQRLAERIVRLRERIETLRDRAASFAELEQPPSARRVRRLLKDLDASLSDAEYYLLERLYSGLDGSTTPLLNTVERHLAGGMPAPGILTSALLDANLPAPRDRSAMLLNLSRALMQARTGAGADLLLAIQEGRPIGEAADELRIQLDGILEILLSWEDFNSAVNLLRSLLERQRGLYLRTQEASER